MKHFFLLLVSASVVSAAVFFWVIYSFTAPGPLETPATVVFPPSTHFTAIAETLGEERVIAHPFLFKMLAALRGDAYKFKAGEYAFPAHISAFEVEQLMAGGKTVVHHLTVPEGLMTQEILDLVKHSDGLDGEITLDIQEGELLPETYNYTRGDKRNELLIRMHHAMQKALDEAWQGRADGLPFTMPEQALTLASIVEKETGLKSERPHVAAVYINRLRKGMLLQADPTTAYAVTGGKHKLERPLSLKDLEMDSPYNTYRTPGLPPGPIANPGRAALYATLHPAASDDLYFVATGSGGHNFARTKEQHEENVRRYREIMKKGN